MSYIMVDSVTYIKRSHPFAYVTLTDFEKGKGMIQIYSDWGIFQTVWMGMGSSDIKQFILSCDSGYIKKNLAVQMNYMGVKKACMGKLDRFMESSWDEIRSIISGVNCINK